MNTLTSIPPSNFAQGQLDFVDTKDFAFLAESWEESCDWRKSIGLIPPIGIRWSVPTSDADPGSPGYHFRRLVAASRSLPENGDSAGEGTSLNDPATGVS